MAPSIILRARTPKDGPRVRHGDETLFTRATSGPICQFADEQEPREPSESRASSRAAPRNGLPCKSAPRFGCSQRLHDGHKTLAPSSRVRVRLGGTWREPKAGFRLIFQVSRAPSQRKPSASKYKNTHTHARTHALAHTHMLKLANNKRTKPAWGAQ